MAGLKQKVAKGAAWATMETLVAQSASFVVGIVLARLLTPSDYGTVALLSIFFAIAGAFASCGFGNALVQKKEAGDLEFNSVFYMSIFASLAVYALLYMAAPWIARFYDTPILCPVTRVSALSFVFNAVNSVQSAELSRKMLFDRRFKIRLITCSISAVSGILLAYLGFGVWAIVFSSLFASVASVVAYWTIIAWRPKLMFSFSTVKGLFSYGWKLSVSGLLHETYLRLYELLIGKFYTPADLAFVNKSRAMPYLLMDVVNGTMTGVSFPALAQLQDDRKRFRGAMRRMLMCSTFLVFPLLVYLSVCAKSMILFLYGDQWLPAVQYVTIGCCAVALGPITNINCMAISALGRSGVFLLLEIFKKVTGLTIMLISVRYSIFAVLVAVTFIQRPIAALAETLTVGKLVGYGPLRQLRDLLPTILLCGIMLIVICGVHIIVLPLITMVTSGLVQYLLDLLISGLLGFSVYFTCAWAFRFKALGEYIHVLEPVLRTRFPKVLLFLNSRFPCNG